MASGAGGCADRNSTGAAEPAQNHRRPIHLHIIIAIIGGVPAFLFEKVPKGTVVQNFGDALYWPASLMTNVGSRLFVLTTAGTF
jgi:hypothetical protein